MDHKSQERYMNVSVTTDANGMYQFMGLANDTYTVAEMMQTGWTNVTSTSIDVLIGGADVMNQNLHKYIDTSGNTANLLPHDTG